MIRSAISRPSTKAAWSARRQRSFRSMRWPNSACRSQGSAEYGRNSGAVVNTVIKSGTNEFHGTLYEFLRNDKLNARNFFETLPGATKGPFKNSNFGGTVGRSRSNTIAHSSLPASKASGAGPVRPWTITRARRRGHRSRPRRERRRRAGRRTRLGAKILSLFPQENIPGAKANYAYSLPNIIDSDNFLVKIDHRFSDRFNLSGRYVFGDGNQTFPLNSGQGSELPAYQTVVPDPRAVRRAELFADADQQADQ